MGCRTSARVCNALHSREHGRFRCDDNSSGRSHAGCMPLLSCMDRYVFGSPFLNSGYTICLSEPLPLFFSVFGGMNSVWAAYEWLRSYGNVFFDGIIVGSFSSLWKCFKMGKRKGLGVDP